jgi:hypothetical protein
LTSEQVKGFLRNSAATVLHNVPFHHPIIELEDYLNSFKMKKSIFANLNESGKKYFKNINYDVSSFYFEETFSTLLRNIRQNLINEYTK